MKNNKPKSSWAVDYVCVIWTRIANWKRGPMNHE
jgi:hypothetical protein